MSNTKPRLSLVIIAYNEEAYIGKCLLSVAELIDRPDEVIVVDNNSTDRTAEIAKAFTFVKLVTETEQGIAPARNRGFNEATGDLIARIDADTELPKHWVQAVHDVMDSRANTISATSGPAYIYDLPLDAGRDLMGHAVLKGYFDASKMMLGHETLYGSNMVMTKLAWDKVKNEVCNNSKELHEDMDLALHIAQYGDIYYDKELKAGVAKRAFIEPIKKTIWRLRIWPKTVTSHRKLFAKQHPKVPQ